MKNIAILICFFIIGNSCKEINDCDGNTRLISEPIIKYIREYYSRNKEILTHDDFILRILSNTYEDSIVVSIDYIPGLYSVYTQPALMFGYCEDIPFVYYSGAEQFFNYKTDSISYRCFLKNVFKRQYERYIEVKTLDPPPAGVCEVIHIVIVESKIVRVEYSDNTLKNSHEIK